MAIDLKKEAQIYADFMTEIKERRKAAEFLMRRSGGYADSNDPGVYVDAESAILQTRFICELIALASLAAHSQFGLSKGLLKSWHAERSFRELEETNQDCFPRTIRQVDGQTLYWVPDTLDRKGLEGIYNQCGSLLHRGVVRHALEGKHKLYDLAKVAKWLSQIDSLLRQHIILLLKQNVVLAVTMSVPPNGSVQVALGAVKSQAQ